MNTQPASLTAGKVLARRANRTGSTALVLNYPKNEAQRIRDLIESIRLRGNRKPSLSLIARRSIAVYLDHLQSSRNALENEVQALEILGDSHRNSKEDRPGLTNHPDQP